MVLRRRVGMRDWGLAAIVVTIAQLTGTNAIAWAWFAVLLTTTFCAMALWLFVFPRVSMPHALVLEGWMNAGSSVTALLLVAVSGGASSPYVYFFALTMIFVAAFIERAVPRILLITLAAGCALAPVFYDWGTARDTNFVPTIVIAVAVWVTAAVLIALKRSSAINAELAARRLAFVDRITGAANRRAIEQYASELAAQGVESALVFVRLDGLGEVNRRLGHFRGDEMLREATGAMRLASIDVDQVARLGGAEFAVLLPGADHDAAQRWCNRFRERLEIVNARAAIDGGARLSAVSGIGTGVEGNFSARLAEAGAAASVLIGPSVAPQIPPPGPAERAERLREQMKQDDDLIARGRIESFQAPTSAWLAVGSALALAVAVALTGGASSVLFSFAILLVTYVGVFGTRAETILTVATTLAGGIVAILVNTPVSNADSTRALTILVTVAVAADTVQRSSRRLRVAERRAAELSLADALTGLANRSAFERDLARMIAADKSHPDSRELRLGGTPAVIALDLAGFSELHDQLDHAEADLLLVEIAEALRDALSEHGTMYRIGVDDFAAVLRAHHMQHVDTVAVQFADALTALDADRRYADRDVAIEYRIGGALLEDGMSPADLAAAAIGGQAPVKAQFDPLRPEPEYATQTGSD